MNTSYKFSKNKAKEIQSLNIEVANLYTKYLKKCKKAKNYVTTNNVKENFMDTLYIRKKHRKYNVYPEKTCTPLFSNNTQTTDLP